MPLIQTMLIRSSRLRSLLTLSLAVLAGTHIALAAEDGKRPNVLVIVADDLGYGDLGFQGGKDVPTPHLNELTRTGTRCTSGYVSCPVCSPTRAGLSQDVGEKKDLSADKPDVVKELKTKFASWDSQLAEPLWKQAGGRRQQK